MPAWVSCYVNTIRDTLTSFMDVRAVITLMDIVTDSSYCGDTEDGQVLSLVCKEERDGKEETTVAY